MKNKKTEALVAISAISAATIAATIVSTHFLGWGWTILVGILLVVLQTGLFYKVLTPSAPKRPSKDNRRESENPVPTPAYGGQPVADQPRLGRRRDAVRPAPVQPTTSVWNLGDDAPRGARRTQDRPASGNGGWNDV